MSLVCLQSRAARFTYDLATVTRSVGYLQGGYKDSRVTDIFQLFNTITGVGLKIEDSGHFRAYCTGISGNFVGWYCIDKVVNMRRWSYVTSTGVQSWVLPPFLCVAASRDLFYDTSIYGRTGGNSWPVADAQVGGCSQIIKTNQATETHFVMVNGGDDVRGSSRQAGASTTHAFFVRNSQVYSGQVVYNFDTEARNYDTSGVSNGGLQLECYAHRDSSKIHLIGLRNPNNWQINIDGNNVLGSFASTNFRKPYGESHTLTSDTRFYAMCGYNDPGGKYGSQHAYCDAFVFETSATVAQADLIKTQSSGQMLQGF